MWMRTTAALSSQAFFSLACIAGLQLLLGAAFMPALAQAPGGNCERFKDPHAYNQCLASAGPRARTSVGAGPLPDLGYAPIDNAEGGPVQRSVQRAGDAPRRVSNSSYLNMGGSQQPRARQTVRIPRR